MNQNEGGGVSEVCEFTMIERDDVETKNSSRYSPMLK